MNRKRDSIPPDSDKMTQEDWLEYLNNYIERHLISQQSSGFSKWALTGILVVILYRFFDYLPQINENRYLCAIFFLNILNLYSVYLCTESFFTKTILKYIDSPYLQRSARLYLCFYVIVVAMGIMSSYWLSEYVRKEGYPNYGYFILTIIYSVYLVDTIYRFYSYERSKKQSQGGIPNIAFCSMRRANRRVRDGMGGILFFLGTIFSLSGISWNDFIVNIRIFQLSMEYCAFIYIAQYLVERLPVDRKIEELQVLEYKIVLYNLNADDIRKEFRSIHFEKTIHNWIEDKRLVRDELIGVIGYYEENMNKAIEGCEDAESVVRHYNFLCLSMEYLEKQLFTDDRDAEFLLPQLEIDQERTEVEHFQKEVHNTFNNLRNMKQKYLEIQLFYCKC